MEGVGEVTMEMDSGKGANKETGFRGRKREEEMAGDAIGGVYRGKETEELCRRRIKVML